MLLTYSTFLFLVLGLAEKPVEEKKDEKQQRIPALSILQLFRFASPLDILLLLVGTLAGSIQDLYNKLVIRNNECIQYLRHTNR